MKKIVIIGGGASGLMASIFAKTKETEVILLEKNSCCGKKLLATGNGRCNYWNEDQDLKHYNSNNKEYLTEIITHDNKKEIMTLFEKIGIIPKIKNGYYYPYSNQAISIRNALVVEAKQLGVKIYTNAHVENIEKSQDKYIIKVNNQVISCDSLIIATGSKAAPKTGSDGNGYSLVKKLGHTVIEPLPALVQLTGHEKYFKDWNGIRSDVKIKLLFDDKFIKEEYGEIQLTDYGISGICTFNLSRFASRYLKEQKKVEVVINFLPFIENDILTWLDERATTVKNRNLLELLEGVLNNKLVGVMLNLSNINEEKKWHELKMSEKNCLITNLTSFRLNITGTKSFDNAQVCSGGVPLAEVNPQTMGSLLKKNLYIIGELLDVDGDCGGYNLSFAWISGMLAGKSSRS